MDADLRERDPLAPATPDDVDFTVRFGLWDRVLSPRPGPEADEPAARLLGVPEAELRWLVTTFEQAVEEAAAGLRADAGAGADIDALPFADGATVVAVGDSITAERASWFEILRRLDAGRRRLVNVAVSGDTTVHARARLEPDALALRPDWALVLIGSNDSRFHRGRVLVSREESERNLDRIVDELHEAGARVVLLSPPRVIEETLARRPFGVDMVWRNDELAARAEATRRVAARRGTALVDVFAAFAGAGAAEFLPDGLHPGVAGQTRIVRELARVLARGEGARQTRPPEETLAG